MKGNSHKEDLFFKLFVYGTLKCGFSNHDLFCQNALEVSDAVVQGELYGLPFGFPGLVVDPENIVASGTTGYTRDAAAQCKLSFLASQSGPLEGPKVFGEIFTFDDPLDRLPMLDHLEGFDPGGSSLYRRILIPVETATGSVLAWAYAIAEPTGKHLPDGVWPP